MKSTKGVVMSDSAKKPLTTAKEFSTAIENDPILKSGLLSGDDSAFAKYFSLAGVEAHITSVSE